MDHALSAAVESLHFFTRRLCEREHSRKAVKPAQRWVKRSFALRIAPGTSQRLPHASRRLVVSCAQGRLWITHDGDPRDVVLGAGDSYRVDSERPMQLHALEAAVLTVEFDEVAQARR